MDFYLRYAEMIKAVTPADVLETAQRYLHHDRLAIAIAGPEGDQETA
jgi:predicted Zn-dependent peptidase